MRACVGSAYGAVVAIEAEAEAGLCMSSSSFVRYSLCWLASVGHIICLGVGGVVILIMLVSERFKGRG